MQDYTPLIEWAVKGIIGFLLYRFWTWIEGMKKKQIKMELDLALLQKDHENKTESTSRTMHELTEALRENTREIQEFRKTVYEKFERLSQK